MTGRTPGGPPRRIGTTTGISPSARREGSGGWWFWALLLAAVVAIGRCSSHDASTTPSASPKADAATGQQALAAAVAEQAPAPIVALSALSVGTGTSRLAKVADEGLSGEMVFSQNCYAVIGAAFSWRKLDECGAFDAAAIARLGDGTPVGLDGEVAWFDGEAAAGRYLRAATAAGMDPGVADVRLDALRSQVARRGEPRRASAPPTTDVPAAEPDLSAPPPDDADGNAVADG